MQYDLTLWDLDGTIAESHPGILNSLAYAFQRMEMPQPTPQELRSFIGPSLWTTFRQRGLSESDVARAVAFYREYYMERGILEQAPYEGVEHALAALRSHGVRIALATAKPEAFAVQIVRNFGLEGMLEGVCGSEMAGGRTEKDQIIAEALRRYGGTNVLMIGDRQHDILGAAAHGIHSAGVLWGYGSGEELAAAGATLLLATPREIVPAVLGREPEIS